MPTEDYYQLLGLGHDALASDIKKAFRKLSLKYHPDKTDDKLHHDLFLKVNEAYEVLKSPDTRRQYDVKIGAGSSVNINVHGFSPGKSSTRNAGYYGFYQSYYKRQDDHLRQAEQEKANFERERRQAFESARRAEELLRRRNEEILKEQFRKQQVKNEQLKRQQELNQKEKLQEYLRKQELRRNIHLSQNGRSVSPEKEANAQDSTGQTRSYTSSKNGNSGNNVAEEDSKSSYEQAKQAAYKNARSAPKVTVEDNFDRQYRAKQEEINSPPASDGPGTNSSDPIVLSDEDDNADSFYSVHEEEEESPEGKNSEEFAEAKSESPESVSSSAPTERGNETPTNNVHEPSKPSIDPLGSRTERLYNLFDSTMNIRPRQEPSFMRNRRSVSPRRQTRPNYTPTTKNGTKRAKNDAFSFSDLLNNLGTNIDEVDFSDMLESLPEGGTRRKPSVSMMNKSKRAKLSEYSDGTSKADTLHMPINKNTVKAHPARITVLDLHASPSILSCRAPKPPQATIDPNIEENEWQRYVINIENYEKQFLEYKRIIIQYQLERVKRDRDFFNEINTNSTNFKVYQESLQRDLEVQQDYVDQLRTYTNLMNVYQQNRNWMNRLR